MGSIATTEFTNILIIKPSAAGDIISALPVLPALKGRYPRARISWFVASHLADLVRGHPLIDDVVEFDRRRYGYLPFSWTVTRRFVRFLKDLRGRRFDLVLDFQGLFRSGFFARVTGAPVRVGPAEKREFGWVFYTHRLSPRPYDTHIVDRLAGVGELLGLDLSEPRFVVPIQPEAEGRIRERLSAAGIAEGGFIVLAPGGTWVSKRWPAERFGELAELIRTRLALPVVLIGGKRENSLAVRIGARASGTGLLNLTGQTSLPELLAVLKLSRGLVCNDSGPMHMAVALGKPVTAIIGPTNPHRTGPYRRPEGVVRSGVDCGGCLRRVCNRVPKDQPSLCMQKISPEQVLENLRTQMG